MPARSGGGRGKLAIERRQRFGIEAVQKQAEQNQMTSDAALHCRLEAGSLHRDTDIMSLTFDTTADLEPLDGETAQPRARDAVVFGIELNRPGYNLFVIGPPEIRMQEVVRRIIKTSFKDRRPPSDWVYVNNFKGPNKPIAIELPAGRATQFHDAMHELVDDLKATLPAVFEGEDYAARRAAIDERFQTAQSDALSALRDKASGLGIAIIRTPFGFTLAPERDGSVVPPSEFAGWPDDEQKKVRESIEALEKDLEQVVRQVPRQEKQHRDALRQLNREMAEAAVGHLIDETKAPFADLPQIIARLETVRADLIENVAIFVQKSEDSGEIPSPPLAHSPFDRYEVNVLVTHPSDGAPAPVVEEYHPTLGNLMGRIEHVAHQGTLVTNFLMIRPGALHRANGGILLLDIRNILMEPFSWAALKRCLRRGMIVIEDVAQLLGFATSSPLEPDPIPLDTKIVLFGERLLYYLLCELDPEVAHHFKVLADFEDDMERTVGSEMLYARIIASIAQHERLQPLSRQAVAAVIDRSSRMAGQTGKLSLLTEHVRDLLVEANQLVQKERRTLIEANDIAKALDQKERRNSRLRDRVQETILQQSLLIATSGAVVGQVNALSVLEVAGFPFGRPTRVTCRVRPGSGKLVDIEREVALGGPTHSKGVLILSGYLAGRYALDTPMSLFASLVFEQSYGCVEGDSASAAELLALLSALSEVPLRQDLAITGSVNQNGDIQAIGGVNEKIEGFFDICSGRGLTGSQGVVIPKSNIKNLMLKREVVDACKAGKFAIYAIETIDEGLGLVTGIIAGRRQLDGDFPFGSVNYLVEERLRRFAEVRRTFSGGVDAEDTTDG
jgi:lon-related putative ATP-dependent protease